MLIKNIIMEPSITDGKASKLSGIPIWVFAAVNGRID